MKRMSWMVIAAGAAMSLSGVAMASPQESVTFNGVNSNGVNGSSFNEVRTHTFAGGYQVGKIRLSGNFTEINTATFGSEIRIGVFAPNGANVGALAPFTVTGFTGTISVTDYVLTLTQPVANSTGTWTFRFYETFDDGGTGSIDGVWDDVTITLDDEVPPPPPPPPGVVDLGTLNYGDSISRSADALNPGEIRWYQLTIPSIDRAARSYLDIDTSGSTIGAGTDTEIGLYAATGFLAASDDDDGPLSNSALSFGRGTRPLTGGASFDGRDGSLPAGVYYLAAGGFNMTFPTFGYGVTTTSTSDGSLNLNISCGQVPPPSEPSAIDLGTLANGTTVITIDDLVAGDLRWYKFTLAQALDASKFLDIDTFGSALFNADATPTTDTEIGLYGADSLLKGSDDDDGAALTSQLSFGGGSTTPVPGDSLPYNGRDGVLPAGTYYLAVSAFDTSFGPDDWAAATTHTKSGTIVVNINTNAGQAPCPADFNGDGFVDFFDFDDFVACFEGVFCPPGTSADFNDDGFVDFFDYDDFVLAFETGCP